MGLEPTIFATGKQRVTITLRSLLNTEAAFSLYIDK